MTNLKRVVVVRIGRRHGFVWVAPWGWWDTGEGPGSILELPGSGAVRELLRERLGVILDWWSSCSGSGLPVSGALSPRIEGV
jgi:hypothetical protein